MACREAAWHEIVAAKVMEIEKLKPFKPFSNGEIDSLAFNDAVCDRDCSFEKLHPKKSLNNRVIGFLSLFQDRRKGTLA